MKLANIIIVLNLFSSTSLSYLIKPKPFNNIELSNLDIANQDRFNNNPHYIHNNKRSGNNSKDNREPKQEITVQNKEILCPMESLIVERQSDLSILDHCNTILNDLIVTSEYKENILDLKELTTVQGHVIVENCDTLIKIVAPNLQKIHGDFTLTSLTSIVILEVPNLIDVNSIQWKILPILNQIEINPNMMVHETIVISDTSISNLEGFHPIKELDTFNINNNRFLETIKASLVNVNTQFTIHANSKDLQIELPFLQNVENITIRDAHSIWLPNLKTVSTNLEFIENGCVDLDLGRLETVGGTVGIIDNNYLSKMNFNNVTDIQGGLVIDNNPRLESINTFQNLKTIGGAIQFSGSFKDTSFPNLKLVKGSAFIKTSSAEMDCNKWIRPMDGRSIIRGGKIKCTSHKKQNSISLDEDGKIIDMQESEVNNEKANVTIIPNTAATSLNLNCGQLIFLVTCLLMLHL